MKVAVLGLGNAGFDLHVPAATGLSGVTCVAADPDETRRARAAERFRIPVFESFDALLAAGRPDLVVVATTPASHEQLCRQAVEAGANVLCEKPFAPSLAEARNIVAAATRAGRHIALNHEFREMPVFKAVRDQLGTPGVGELLFVQAWQNMDLPPWKEKGWRGRLLMGTLYEAGLHLVDYCMALFGEKPSAVTATMSTCGVRSEESDAVALVTMEFSRGRLASIVQNRLCAGETQFFEIRADAARASLRASFGGRARLSAGMYRSTRPHVRLEFGASGIAWREQGHARETIAKNPKEPAMFATRRMLERTLEAFSKGTRPPATGEDGCDALEVLAACYRSAEKACRVPVNGTDDLVQYRFAAET